MRYLKGNPRQGILLRSDSDLQIYAFYDSDWEPCTITQRYLTRYLVTLGGSPIYWKIKKPSTTSRSSIEAEHMVMATVTSELIWIKSFLDPLGVFMTKPM